MDDWPDVGRYGYWEEMDDWPDDGHYGYWIAMDNWPDVGRYGYWVAMDNWPDVLQPLKNDGGNHDWWLYSPVLVATEAVAVPTWLPSGPWQYWPGYHRGRGSSWRRGSPHSCGPGCPDMTGSRCCGSDEQLIRKVVTNDGDWHLDNTIKAITSIDIIHRVMSFFHW